MWGWISKFPSDLGLLDQEHLLVWNCYILDHQNQRTLRLDAIQRPFELPTDFHSLCVPNHGWLKKLSSLGLIHLAIATLVTLLLLDAKEHIMLLSGSFCLEWGHY